MTQPQLRLNGSMKNNIMKKKYNKYYLFYETVYYVLYDMCRVYIYIYEDR